jgi:hypothetical protein
MASRAGTAETRRDCFPGSCGEAGKKEFDRSIAERKSRHPRGRGREKKLKEFRKWKRGKISRKRLDTVLDCETEEQNYCKE